MLALYRRCIELFHYDEGKLIRKTHASPNARKGSIAGNLDLSGGGIGYFRVKIERKSYLIHRLIYLIHNKDLPVVVDHVDGNTHNNLITNLRASDKKLNRWNCTQNKNTYSGVKGVYLDGNRWKAMINVEGKRYYLGLYDDIISAKNVVDAKYIELQGDFSKQNSMM